MKVISTATENVAIASICDGSPEVREILLSNLRTSHFGYEPNIAIFKRIHRLAQDGKSIPRREQFFEDITLGEEAKTLLKNDRVTSVKKDQVDGLMRGLEQYRKLRIISSALIDATGVLTGKGPKHVDKIAHKLIKSLNKVESYDDLKVSSSENCLDLIDKILEGERSIVPTGIKAFDEVNGGMPDGQVVILAADSGGGKSAFAIQLAINQYFSGYSTLILSMEMSEEEIWSRVWSNLTGVQHDKFILKECTKKEKAEIKNEVRAFHKFGSKNNCRFQIVCPRSDRKFSEWFIS